MVCSNIKMFYDCSTGQAVVNGVVCACKAVQRSQYRSEIDGSSEMDGTSGNRKALGDRGAF